MQYKYKREIPIDVLSELTSLLRWNGGRVKVMKKMALELINKNGAPSDTAKNELPCMLCFWELDYLRFISLDQEIFQTKISS